MFSRTDIDGTSFLDWLINKKGLKCRSAKDVFSRLKRASGIMHIDPSAEYVDIIYFLSKEKKFQSLSYTVKSQLRRSILLFIEYKKANELIIDSKTKSKVYKFQDDIKIVAEQ